VTDTASAISSNHAYLVRGRAGGPSLSMFVPHIGASSHPQTIAANPHRAASSAPANLKCLVVKSYPDIRRRRHKDTRRNSRTKHTLQPQ